MKGCMWAASHLGDEGEIFQIIVANHQNPTTKTIIAAGRTRHAHLKHSALEFCGISSWQNWDTESWKSSTLLEQPIGQLLRTEVRVVPLLCIACGTQQRLSKSDMHG